MQTELEILRTRLAESEALVGRYKTRLLWVVDNCDSGMSADDFVDAIQGTIEVTPSDALAEYRDGVMEGVAEFAESEASFAVEAEKQAACKVGELQYAIRWAHRAETLEAFANTIRAMKAPEKGGTR
jgi:hypothetical protein